ncbi:MAG: glycerate kinase [Clostridia bacterium]|nr:glycerate kinase [Clostridia bacterium]
MKIVVAMDSFKGSVTSLQAGNAVAEGLRRAHIHADITVLGLADGGEGTAELVTRAMGGQMYEKQVTGPLGAQVSARWGYVAEKGLAVIEMAEAAGLPLVPEHLRDPRRTTTFGVGELMREALRRGCREMLLCLGGSATNDGAMGALTALGARFYDEKNELLGVSGADMCRAARADLSGLDAGLHEMRIRIACDVTNPLCGELGAAAVFGPQKGADETAVAELDAGLARFADVISAAVGRDLRNEPGAGAAGGMAFGLMSVLSAEPQMGASLVLASQGAQTALRGADLAITGEGSCDGQTAAGKGPAAFCRMAKAAGAVTVALCGSIGSGADNSSADALFCIQQGAVSLAKAMEPEYAVRNIAKTAEQVLRLYLSRK